jgi:Signal peptidase, peptidase S26
MPLRRGEWLSLALCMIVRRMISSTRAFHHRVGVSSIWGCGRNGRARSRSTGWRASSCFRRSLFRDPDNRDRSSDSRCWGFVDRRAIMGRPIVIYWFVEATAEDYSDRSLYATLRGIEDTLASNVARAPLERVVDVQLKIGDCFAAIRHVRYPFGIHTARQGY